MINLNLTMKAVVVLFLVFSATCVSAKILNVSQRSVYGYLTEYGIPEAERIKKAEDHFLSRSSRISGGAPAGDAQFPYQAGILADLRNIIGQAVCGGSLIQPNRVLTAAHCWWDGRNQALRFTVVLGSNLLFSGGERIITNDISTHPLWVPLVTFNDIAMVRIPDVQLSDRIAVVALPDERDIFDSFRRQRAVASGFGLKEEGMMSPFLRYYQQGGSFGDEPYLSYVNLTVISNDVCNVAHLGQIRFSHLCTSTTGGMSTCTGDFGGPLVIQRNNEPLLIGVASFNFGCELGWPAVFSRVTSFLSFIRSN